MSDDMPRRPVAPKPVHWHDEQQDWYVWISEATQARRPASRRDLAAEVERLREDLAHTRRMLTILREGDGHMIREAVEILREELDEMPPEIAGFRSMWLDKLMIERDMLRANVERLERAASDGNAA